MTNWTDESKKAFEKVKCYLTKSPILSNPQSGEQLYMYLVMFDYTTSTVLFWHIEVKEQRPCLLHEQNNGKRGDPVLQNGMDDLSLEIRRLETSSVLSSSPNDCTPKSTT